MPIKIKMKLSDMVDVIGKNADAEIVWVKNQILVRSGYKHVKVKEFDYVVDTASKKMMASLKLDYDPRPHDIGSREAIAIPLSRQDIAAIKNCFARGAKLFTGSVGDRYRWSVR